MLKEFINKIRNKTSEPYSEHSLMNTFARLPVSFSRGQGTQLWDTDGNQYLDALGGIAVTILGHSHPKISEIISLQANKLMHCSNLFHIQEQAQLGEKFCQIAEMDKVFFCNSGAEANEAAIKIARLYGNQQNIATPTIITAHNSFHGRTMATLSATGNEGLQKGFEPLLEDFIHVEYNSIEAIEEHASNEQVVAVMMEPIQGESGIIMPDEGYLKQLREVCDRNNWLLILDEIQTGMGRTGKWFAYQHEDITPDIMTSAKALGNGVPIGACAARGKAAEVLGPGTHGSTFGGNPFACQVAMSVIEVMQSENLVEQAASRGAYLKTQLSQNLATLECVTKVRGKGMMLAVELDQPVPDLAVKLLNEFLVVNITGGGKIIRLLPAVIMTENECRQVAEIIQTVLSQLK